MTGRNIAPITSSANWLFVEVIDTLRHSPAWDNSDFRVSYACAADCIKVALRHR